MLCSTFFSCVGIPLAFPYLKSVLMINFSRMSSLRLLEVFKVLTNPNMERSLPDWNKTQNSKNNNLVILMKNTAITLNCFVQGAHRYLYRGPTDICTGGPQIFVQRAHRYLYRGPADICTGGPQIFIQRAHRYLYRGPTDICTGGPQIFVQGSSRYLYRGPADIYPAGRRAECENNTCVPFWRTLTCGPKFPLQLALFMA
jgi:hypothetical protein